jgi:hypothetical protein
MKPPRRRLTLRALMLVIVLFAVNFAGLAWEFRQQPPGARVDNPAGRRGLWAQVPPPADILAPLFFAGPFLLVFAMIYLYVPRKLDELLIVLLMIIVLVMLIVPSLQHS